jgi:hypothetical protein
MRLLKAMLVVACLTSAISIFRTIVPPAGTIGTVTAIVNKAVFGCALYGIHNRAPVMWKLGFAFIVFSGAMFLVQSLTMTPTRATNTPIKWGFLTIVTLAVTTYWLFRWKRQKPYFVDGSA